MALSTQALPRQIRGATADLDELSLDDELSLGDEFPSDGRDRAEGRSGTLSAVTDSGPGYAVATIIVQAGDGSDTSALTAFATQLADDVREALRHGVTRAAVSAVVAVSGPSRSDLPAGAVPQLDLASSVSLAGSVSPDTADRIVVDRTHRYAAADGRALDLTYREFELLAFLVEHPGRAFSRAHLLRTVWDHAEVGSRTVDVHIRRLRVKLGPQAHRLTTIRNIGYRLEPQAGNKLARGLPTVA